MTEPALPLDARADSEPMRLSLQARLALTAVAAHCALWWIGTSSLLGSVHIDSSEIAYWGRSLALGYSKHPPLPSWIAAAAMLFSPSPIVALLAMGQACVAIAAAYVWATIRLFASRNAALVGVLVLIASPAATLYAVQVNHNTMLIPFWAATLFYAARYLERGGIRAALGAGAAAALGFLSKYEIVVLVIPILCIAVAVEPYRRRLLRWETLVAALVFTALVMPHLVWLVHHRGSTLEHATAGRKLHHLYDAGFDLYAFLLGQVLLFGVPFVTGLLLRRPILPFSGLAAGRRASGRALPPAAVLTSAAIVGPILLMVAGSLATWQTVKPLWVIPFAPSVAVWVGYRFGDAWMERTRHRTTLPFALVSVSLATLVGFLIVLCTSAMVGQPIPTYMADTRWLAQQAEDLWRAHDRRPLRWVLTDRSGLTSTAALWMADAPQVDLFTAELEPETADILRSGGIALLRNPPEHTAPIAGLCPTAMMEVTVPVARFGTKGRWPVWLAYLPPRDDAASACPASPADNPDASSPAAPASDEPAADEHP